MGAVILVLAGGTAWAARPMITDDARITDAKACQLESWVRVKRDSHERWALPACNFSGSWELTVGGAVGNADDGMHTTDLLVQGKTLFRPLAANGWGAGLVLGTVSHPLIDPGRNLLGDVYAYLPLSLSLADDRFVLHANFGALHERSGGRNRATWGFGSETQLADGTWLIAETFGQSGERGFYQVGVRHWLVPHHVQVDATYGNRIGPVGADSERWFSLGLRLISLPFLP
jgi:hypothetical protein